MNLRDEYRNRAQGLLLGLAAGDRNGGPIRMASFVAKTLLSRSAFDPDDLFNRYLDWWHTDAFDTGEVFTRVFHYLEQGIDRVEAARRTDDDLGGLTGGCNPAHRASVLAAAGFLTDTEVADFAREEARLTHYSPIAGEVSAAVAELCRRLIRGFDWGVALGRIPPVALPGGRLGFPRNELSRGGFAPQVFAAAVHFLDRAESFEKALESSLEFAGPANYCPVLVGSIGGARWGADKIPAGQLNHRNGSRLHSTVG